MIREVEVKDAREIIQYCNQVGGESDNLTFGYNEFQATLEEEEQYIRSIKSALNSQMLVYIQDKSIVSVGTVRGYERTRIAHRCSMGITVKKDYWNRGIATEMMEKIIEWCRERGMKVIELEVREDNKNAIRLYEKYGFETIGLYKKYFRIEDEFYDARLMNLYL